ncbi:hypothetical protein Nizo3892_2111 [Lactiplantibacillus plantarum]|uniref:hypothetical protein n=1 Tax=Lactiplantibacillus plantarum TaxID=1590 RepID=UPI0007B557DC|nr:hypothetical protein [Lactiplantibacillus plantarum]KZU81088.1 hypothetical protein Nizo3892_2111 [Lactiplantibacillus plantarum]MBO2727730.1 hypothetical protein [Lactiplantibacillus plantarum]
MINPLLNVASTNSGIVFTNVFNEKQILKKISVKNKKRQAELIKKLKTADMNLDFVVVNAEKGLLLQKIASLINNEQSFYTKDSLTEKVFQGLENSDFRLLGKTPHDLIHLKALTREHTHKLQTNYIISYSNFEELKNTLQEVKLKDSDTLFFIGLSETTGLIKSIGPMIKQNGRTDLDSILVELQRPKDSIDITGTGNEKFLLDEYLRALVDYFTEFFSNYSHVWEREIEISENAITLSERILN